MAEPRKRLIAGNWKMNKTESEAKMLTQDIIAMSNDNLKIDVVLCPPFTSLSNVKSVLNKNIKLGAQNFYHAEEGAFTGEISAKMLNSLGVKYVIIGHSERREIFHEDNQLINQKILTAIKNNLTPILCVGESLEQRESNQTFNIIKAQISENLKNVSPEQAENIVIAYEPIWAIGTGMTATPQMAQEVHSFIRNLLLKTFGQIAQKIRILYGGSMKPENAQDLLEQPDIDGGLIGGASLKADSFSSIIEAANNF